MVKLMILGSRNLLFHKSVGLDAEGSEKVEYSTNNYFDGWKVHLHEPHGFPEVMKKGIIVGSGSEVSIRY